MMGIHKVCLLVSFIFFFGGILLLKLPITTITLGFVLLASVYYGSYRAISSKGEWANVIGTQYRFPLGDLIDMQISPNGRYLLNLCKKLGMPQVYRIWFGPIPVLMLAHPEAVRQFWRQHDETSVERVVKLGWSLLLIMGEGIGFKTYRNRNRISRFFHSCFSPRQVMQYEASYEREVDLIMKRLETLVTDARGSPLDIAIELKYLAHDAGMDLFLGPNSGKYLVKLHELVDALVLVMTDTFNARYINLPLLQWILPKSYRLRANILGIRRQWNALLHVIMDECEADGSIENETDNDSIVVRYMRMQAAGSEKEITFEEMSDTIIEGLLAPSDGAAATFANTLILLALNQNAQADARDLIRERVPPSNLKSLTLADIAGIDHLDHILSECQRMLPIFMFNVPELTSCEMTLGGVIVPQDTMVMYDVQTLNRSEDIWPEPLVFRPERFQKLKGKQHKALHGFGNGRSRRCLGEHLVRSLHKLFIARILVTYRLEPGDNERNIDELPRARRPFIYVPHVLLKFIPLND